MDRKKQSNRFRKKFRQRLLNLLIDEPDHPLRFLLDKDKFYKQAPGSILDEHGVNALFFYEAGHRISTKHDREREIKGVEELGVQSRYYNQLDAQTVESKGVGFSVETSFYNVNGVPVEFRTLREYCKFGLISEEVYNSALQSGEKMGWVFDEKEK